jgi:hypothetical protein
MTTPLTLADSGCPDWPVLYPGGAPCPALASLDPAEQELYEAMAAQYLWNWTGRALGTCPVLARPCRSDCPGASLTSFWGLGPYSPGSASGGARWGPVLVNGQWFNITCGTCRDECSCGGPPALRLPGPVASITQVLIDGVVLPQPGHYRVDNHTLLVRTDGEAWPTCQDMSAPTTAENTFEVSYLYGATVPPQGQLAAGVLACELGKAAAQDPSCLLPRRLQTIARQGVTMTFLDSMDDLDKGRTGIWVVDSWVASLMNPPVSGRVFSVDIPRPRVRVTTWDG